MTGQPKDHLGPGGARRGEEPGTETPAGREAGREDLDAGRTTGGGKTAVPAVPAEPRDVPGAPDAAARGKATRSPAEVAKRPHLEGSEQGPM